MKKYSILLLMATILIGCGCKKVSTTEMHTIEVSQPINDHVFIRLPVIQTVIPECDSICNDAVRLALSNIETTKISGVNSYGFKFDKDLDGFKLDMKMGETRNENKVKTEVIERKVYPKWLVFLGIVGFLAILFVLYRISRIFVV